MCADSSPTAVSPHTESQVWSELFQFHCGHLWSHGCACSVFQLCPTLYAHVDCSPRGSSVHGILQARKLEWVVVPSSRESSRPKGRTQVSCIAGRFFFLKYITIFIFTDFDIHIYNICFLHLSTSLQLKVPQQFLLKELTVSIWFYCSRFFTVEPPGKPGLVVWTIICTLYFNHTGLQLYPEATICLTFVTQHKLGENKDSRLFRDTITKIKNILLI